MSEGKTQRPAPAEPGKSKKKDRKMKMTADQKQMLISRAARGWLSMAESTLDRDDLSVPCHPKDQMSYEFIDGTGEELGFEPTKSAVAEMRRAAVKYAFDLMRAANGETNRYFERLWESDIIAREDERKMKQYRADCRASWRRADAY